MSFEDSRQKAEDDRQARPAEAGLSDHDGADIQTPPPGIKGMVYRIASVFIGWTPSGRAPLPEVLAVAGMIAGFEIGGLFVNRVEAAVVFGVAGLMLGGFTGYFLLEPKAGVLGFCVGITGGLLTGVALEVWFWVQGNGWNAVEPWGYLFLALLFGGFGTLLFSMFKSIAF